MTVEQRILVIGEALIDIVDGEEVVGGSPANVALGLGRLGEHPDLLTAVAHDPHGERIRKHLEAAGVHVLPESFSLERTSTATARVTPNGSAEYEFDIEWRLPEFNRQNYDTLHVGSIACFLEPGASRLMELVEKAADSGTHITFDPNIRAALIEPATVRARVEQIAARASIVKLSDEDAHLIYPGASVREVSKQLISLGANLVAVTRGARGATLTTPSHHAEIAAPKTVVVDTVGAGDTFMAATIAFGSRPEITGSTPDDLVRIGTLCVEAAAITVQRTGADLPTREQLAVRMADRGLASII